MQQPIYALLIGIDRYAAPSIPDLGGCVNDAEAMATILQKRFAVPTAQIALLLNEQATVAAVKLAFHQHLLEPVRTYVHQQRTPGHLPAVLFHFSGHGSQAVDPTGRKPSGFDETLVCHDSRLTDIYDLKDWELGQMLDELVQYTENITVILDCCHSGSGTRSGQQEKMVTTVRSCLPDRRVPPTSESTTGVRPKIDHATTPQRAMRGGASDTISRSSTGGGNHLLLAACLNREKAYEYVAPHEPSTINKPDKFTRQRHGALTYYLLQELVQLDATQLPTYHELYEKLKPQVAAHFPQTVQCEGDWGRVIFGTARPNRDLWLSVIARHGDILVANGGAIHGIQRGTRFRVYGPDARLLDDAGPMLGLLEAFDVGVAQSDCRIVEGNSRIPIHARLEPDLATLLTERRTLSVDIRYAQIATAARERLAQHDLASLIALHRADSDTELRLTLLGDDFEIHSAGGSRLGPPYPMRELNARRRPFTAADFDPIASALKRIVRVQTLEALENLGSALADALDVTINQLVVDPVTGDQSTAPLSMSDNGVLTTRNGTPFVIEVTNRYLDALYVGVLLINGTWMIEQLYPEMHGTHVQLAPGNTLRIGLDEGHARQLILTLQQEPATTDAPDGNIVTLLFIATKQEVDFESILQREEALAERMQVQLQTTKRNLNLVPEIDAVDEWMSKRVRVRVVTSSEDPNA